MTCRADSPLATATDMTLVSPAGDERAIVMTRSFASMLALLIGVVERGCRRRTGAWRPTSTESSRAAGPEASAAAAVGRRLGATDWSRVVVLGGGAAFGIAAEWGLKLTETSQVPTSAYEPLEFRHGPISVCEPGVLVVGLVGGPGAADEVRVVAEAARLGAETWVLARNDDGGTRRSGSRSASSVRGLHPSARLPLLLHPGPRAGAQPRPDPRLRPGRATPPRAGRHPRPAMSDADLRLADYRPRPRCGLPAHPVVRPRFPVVDAHNHLGSAFGGDWSSRSPASCWRRPRRRRRRDPRRPRRRPGRRACPREIERWRHAGRPGRRLRRASTTRAGRPIRRSVRPRLNACATRRPAARAASRSGSSSACGPPIRPAVSSRSTTRGSTRSGRPPPSSACRSSSTSPIRSPSSSRSTPTNERWEELREHPDWHFWPTRPAGRRPGRARASRRSTSCWRPSAGSSRATRRTTFVGAHVGCAAEDLGLVGRLLDANPNLSVDIAARLGELGRQPYTTRAFMLRYADRILFGVDLAPDPAIYRLHYRFLETFDESFDYGVEPVPSQGRWQIHGIGLPDDVLRKVYAENAARILKLAVPAARAP